MKQVRWISLIFVATLVLSSCRAASESPVTQAAPVHDFEPVTVQINDPAQPVEAGTNQCLICHADKDQLIATAKPVVEAAESESSGVG